MPSTYVSRKHADLTADGGVDGVAKIGDNDGWLPGCTVWLSADGLDSLECVIAEQVGTDSVRLRSAASSAKWGRSDLSAYTIALNATLDMEGQVVPVRSVFEPRERA